MTAIKKVSTQNPDDPNVRDPEHKHELGGTLGMTVGGVAGAIAAGTAAAAATVATAGAAIPLAGAAAVVGAALGGALGGAAGEEIAREVNPTAEETYWEKTYTTRPYYVANSNFETYRPAYRYGVEAYSRNSEKSFNDIEPTLNKDWAGARGTSNLEWKDAREASRDAYERLQANRSDKTKTNA